MIVEYRISFRKTPTVAFYGETHDLPGMVHYSHDKLTCTRVNTYSNLMQYAEAYNFYTIDRLYDIVKYNKQHPDIVVMAPQLHYKIIGLTGAFCMINTYTFPESSRYTNIFFNSLKLSDVVSNLESYRVTQHHNVVTLAIDYKNCDDYNKNRFAEFVWIAQLAGQRVTRTTQFIENP